MWSRRGDKASLRMTGKIEYGAVILLLCVYGVLGLLTFFVAHFSAFAQSPSTGANVGIASPVGTAGCNTSGSAIIKGNGTGGCQNAVSGTDFAPAAPATTAIKKGNGSGGFADAVSGTDYVPPIDVNNHTTLKANDAANDGNFISVIGTDSSNNVVIGGGVAHTITLNNSAGVNQGTFTSGAFIDAPVVNSAFTGGTEQCAQKWHEYTLAANSTITLSCPALMGNPQQTLDFFFVQPATGTTFTYSFAAANGAALLGDNPSACNVNGCIDQVEVTWVPALNDYIVNLVKANITGVSTCPSGQTCYYVSASSGNDSNSGLDSGHPWLTISKVQTILSSLNPGDEVLFHGGDTWTGNGNGGTNPSMMLGDTSAHAVSGSAAKPILFSTYGSSGRAIIDANNANGYCIAAINPGFTVQYLTISNIECKHAFAQGIYFKTSSGSSSPAMPGITLSNNYVHDTGPGCATASGSCNALPPAWTASNSYGVGGIIQPNTSNSANVSYVNQGSCTSGSSQPNWNSAQSLGNTIADNTCTWTAAQTGRADYWVDWVPSTSYASSGGFGGYGAMFIEPTSNNAASYVYQETAASCTSGTTRPSFPQTVGSTVSDNTCTWKNTGVAGVYLNQLGLEDDGSNNGHSTDAVKILNNIVKWAGGHNALQVHGDLGGGLIQGNTVGPGCAHGCIDVKMVGNSPNTFQILSNTGTCGYGSNLCGCQANGTCASNLTPAFYTQNTVNGVTENVLYQLNVAYDSAIGFQADPNGSGTAYINYKHYNNTTYIPTSGNTFGIGIGLAGTPSAGNSVDIRNDIFDGGANHCVSITSGPGSMTEDYNDIGGAQGCSAFLFNGSSTQGSHDITSNPSYVNAASGNFSLQAGSPCINKGLSGLTTGNNDIGAF